MLSLPGRPLDSPVRARLERTLSRSGLGARPVAEKPAARAGLRVAPPGTASEREAERAGAAFASASAPAPGAPATGVDLAGLRIHSGGTAGASARSLNARAYTVGSDIVFGTGEFAPHTTRGRELLAHEAAHVVQDRRAGPPTLRRQVATDEPAAVEVRPIAGVEVVSEIREMTAPPEPPSLERLEREHPAVARAVGFISRAFRALVGHASRPIEASVVRDRPPPALLFASKSVPRVLEYEQEIADKQLLDAPHLSVWLDHVRTALTHLAPLVEAVGGRTGRELDDERQRLIARVETLAASPFIRTGVEARERERVAVAAQARVDAAVDYLREKAQYYRRLNFTTDQLRLVGPAVAGHLVHDMKLNADEIRAAFDALGAEDPELLDTALFAGGTVHALLYLGIHGFQAYRARGEGFLSGAYRGSRESLLTVKPGGHVFSALERVEAAIWFQLGTFQGIGDALKNNLTSALEMFTPKFWSELKKFFTEQLREFIDNEETRFAAGLMMGQMSAEEERRVAEADAQEYGRTMGHMFGSAIVEIALLFIGIGWVLKAVQASPRLMKALQPLFKLAKYLGELAVVRKGLHLVQILSEGVGVLSRRIRAILLRVPALTRGGKARRALALAELAVEEAAAEARKAEDAVRRALALGDMPAAEKHMRDLEAAAKKVQSKVDILESHGAGVYDEAAAAGTKTVETPPVREQVPTKREPAVDLPKEKPRVGGEPEVATERPRETALEPEAKARTLEEVDEALEKHRRTPDGEHETYVDRDGEPFECSADCDLIRRRYRSTLKRNSYLDDRLKEIRKKAAKARRTGDQALANQANAEAAALSAEVRDIEQIDLIAGSYAKTLKKYPHLDARLSQIRNEARQAHKTGSAQAMAKAQEDAAALRREVHALESEHTLLDIETQPGSATHTPPDVPPQRADPRARGGATELENLDQLAERRATQKLPDWFKTLDGIEGKVKIKVRNGRTQLVFEDAKGYSLKSTEIVDPFDLEEKLHGDLADLLAFDDYTRGRVRVKDLKKRSLVLTFEEGTFQHVEQPGLQELIAEFKAAAKKRGVDFQWNVYMHGRLQDGPSAIRAMRNLVVD